MTTMFFHTRFVCVLCQVKVTDRSMLAFIAVWYTKLETMRVECKMKARSCSPMRGKSRGGGVKREGGREGERDRVSKRPGQEPG